VAGILLHVRLHEKAGKVTRLDRTPEKNRKATSRTGLKPKGQKARCRACRRVKHLGRENICLPCYKKHGSKVHQVAFKRSGPFSNARLAESRVTATVGTPKLPRPTPTGEMIAEHPA
jgi:hypothetical protein